MWKVVLILVCYGSIGIPVLFGDDSTPQQRNPLVGFWIVDLESGVNSENRTEFLPSPFYYWGDTVTILLTTKTPWSNEPTGYLRLLTVLKGNRLYYLAPANAYGELAFRRLSILENGRFCIESSNKKWVLVKRKQDEVLPEFASYFKSIPVHHYDWIPPLRQSVEALPDIPNANATRPKQKKGERPGGTPE